MKFIKNIIFYFAIKTLKVTKIINEYNQVYTYHMKPRFKLKFKAGHHTHLVSPKEKINKENVRHMTIASSPSEKSVIFSMDLSSKTKYKKAFSSLKEGDKVKVFHFGGNFTLEKVNKGSHIVFIAGGVGVTAMRSLIQEIEIKKLPVTYDLIYAGKGYMYKDLFDSLKSNVEYVKRESLSNSIHSKISDENKYFICGSNSFVSGVMEILREKNVSRKMITLENFK